MGIQMNEAGFISVTNPLHVGGALSTSGAALADTTKLSPTGGSKTVAASGTAEALVAAATLKTTLYVRAKVTNTGNVYLGGSSVHKTTSKQIILSAGLEIAIAAPAGYCLDVNEWYIDVDTNGNGVDFLYY